MVIGQKCTFAFTDLVSSNLRRAKWSRTRTQLMWPWNVVWRGVVRAAWCGRLVCRTVGWGVCGVAWYTV